MAKLPIEEMCEKEFNNNFKKKYLDGELSDEALKKIYELFGIGKEETGKVACDDYHAHTFKCVWYKNPSTAVVERLLNEIEKYRNAVKELAKEIRT